MTDEEKINVFKLDFLFHTGVSTAFMDVMDKVDERALDEIEEFRFDTLCALGFTDGNYNITSTFEETLKRCQRNPDAAIYAAFIDYCEKFLPEEVKISVNEINQLRKKLVPSKRYYVTLTDVTDGNVLQQIDNIKEVVWIEAEMSNKLTEISCDNNMTFQQKLCKVTLPQGIKAVRRSAFVGCRCLYKVEIPDSVELVEPHAFDYSPYQIGRIEDLPYCYYSQYRKPSTKMNCYEAFLLGSIKYSNEAFEALFYMMGLDEKKVDCIHSFYVMKREDISALKYMPDLCDMLQKMKPTFNASREDIPDIVFLGEPFDFNDKLFDEKISELREIWVYLKPLITKFSDFFSKKHTDIEEGEFYYNHITSCVKKNPAFFSCLKAKDNCVVEAIREYAQFNDFGYIDKPGNSSIEFEFSIDIEDEDCELTTEDLQAIHQQFNWNRLVSKNIWYLETSIGFGNEKYVGLSSASCSYPLNECTKLHISVKAYTAVEAAEIICKNLRDMNWNKDTDFYGKSDSSVCSFFIQYTATDCSLTALKTPSLVEVIEAIKREYEEDVSELDILMDDEEVFKKISDECCFNENEPLNKKTLPKAIYEKYYSDMLYNLFKAIGEQMAKNLYKKCYLMMRYAISDSIIDIELM